MDNESCNNTNTSSSANNTTCDQNNGNIQNYDNNINMNFNGAYGASGTEKRSGKSGERAFILGVFVVLCFAMYVSVKYMSGIFGKIGALYESERENSSLTQDDSSDEYDDMFDSDQGEILYRLSEYVQNGESEKLFTELELGGYDVNYYDEDFKPLVNLAILYEETEIAKVLLEDYDADPNIYDADYDFWLPINYAIYNEDVDAIKMLAEHGADLEKREYLGDTPLMVAADRGIEVVQCLVELGADISAVDDDGWGVAHYAARRANVQVYEYVVDHGADEHLITDEGYSVGHLSLTSGDVVFVEYMMLRGFELTQPVENGDTLLHMAGSSEVADYIMENYEYDINAIGGLGWTPLHNAAYMDFDESTIRTFLDNGADLSIANDYGETPIFLAYDTYDNMKTLIEYGADVNVQNKFGESVLMFAYEYENVIKLLISNGADITITDNDGYTAYDRALLYEDDGSVTQNTLDMLSGLSGSSGGESLGSVVYNLRDERYGMDFV